MLYEKFEKMKKILIWPDYWSVEILVILQRIARFRCRIYRRTKDTTGSLRWYCRSRILVLESFGLQYQKLQYPFTITCRNRMLCSKLGQKIKPMQRWRKHAVHLRSFENHHLDFTMSNDNSEISVSTSENKNVWRCSDIRRIGKTIILKRNGKSKWKSNLRVLLAECI